MQRQSSDTALAPAEAKSKERVRVWDLPTRIFHWALALAILCGYVSRYYGDADFVWHKWNGYFVLILIVFRIIWGFVGGTTARFVNFFPLPSGMWRYARSFLRGGERYFGHNPLGGAMILVMLVAVLAQGVSGLFNSNDILFDGPFVKLVSDNAVKLAGVIHHYAFKAIELLVVIHIAAALTYHFLKGEPLISAMFTGKKPADTYVGAAELRGGSLMLALACLAMAAILVLATVRIVGGEL